MNAAEIRVKQMPPVPTRMDRISVCVRRILQEMVTTVLQSGMVFVLFSILNPNARFHIKHQW